mgnify:CR=1 FL=1
MTAPEMRSADHLAHALHALRSIAKAATLAWAYGVGTRGWESGAAILADWNDSNDPPDISTSLDGWHGVVKVPGYRIALTTDGSATVLGLYRGGTVDEPLGDPITLDTISD